jgi:hypothetical protein
MGVGSQWTGTSRQGGVGTTAAQLNLVCLWRRGRLTAVPTTLQPGESRAVLPTVCDLCPSNGSKLQTE